MYRKEKFRNRMKSFMLSESFASGGKVLICNVSYCLCYKKEKKRKNTLLLLIGLCCCYMYILMNSTLVKSSGPRKMVAKLSLKKGKQSHRKSLFIYTETGCLDINIVKYNSLQLRALYLAVVIDLQQIEVV
jgi:hypothetical protein